MASSAIGEQLECSICLCIYTDPVMLRCGHNYCRLCIDRVLDSQERTGGYSCPECREEFQDRPALQRNITLCNIVENFLSAQPDLESSGVFCTYCFHAAVPAVKSCLLCDASLCDNHLRVHSKAPEHILCDPTASPESRKCSIHKKILEYYCTEDSASICVSCCLTAKHKGHQMESLNKVADRRKRKLRSDLQKLIISRNAMETRVRSLQEHRRKMEEKEGSEIKRVSDLFRELRRRLEDLENGVLREITGNAERVLLSLDDVIHELEIKKDELSRKMRDIEELCNMADPLTVLQESDTGDLCVTQVEDNKTHDELCHDGWDLDRAWISHSLFAGISGVVSELKVCFSMDQPAHVSLNINTACNKLHISDDRKTASCSPCQKYPETLERFKGYPQVMSEQSFSSGRHYWEVDVGESQWWRVGVCYPSIDRTGVQSWIGNNQKSWGLYRFHGQYLAIHDSQEIQLHDGISSGRVRVYLDYEGGQIFFWAMCDPMRHLHTFTTTFTEPLHAAFGVWKGCVRISR